MSNETFNSYHPNHETSQEKEHVIVPAEEFARRREAMEIAAAATQEVETPPTPVELIGRQSLILFQTRRSTAEAMAARTETLDSAV